MSASGKSETSSTGRYETVQTAEEQYEESSRNKRVEEKKVNSGLAPKREKHFSAIGLWEVIVDKSDFR